MVNEGKQCVCFPDLVNNQETASNGIKAARSSKSKRHNKPHAKHSSYSDNEEITEDISTMKRSKDGQLLDKLRTPTGCAMDIETNTIRAKATQSFEELPADNVLPCLKKKSKSEVDRSSEGASRTQGPKRLRRVARMILANLNWARDMRDKHEEENKFVFNSGTETLTFDLNNFKLSHKTYGGLSPRIRRILAKDQDERTTADILVLRDIVARLQCFRKYSSAAKEELARIIFYDSFEDGRVVIQQGHVGVAFYFIVSGTVQVKVTEYDSNKGIKRVLHLGELSEGSSFGELALLHNIRRTATIVCKGPCEFLRVDRGDFQSVLSSVTNKEYERRLHIMKQLAAFSEWPLEDLKACTNQARIREYAPNQVIMSGESPPEDYVFYVCTGECYILRSLHVLREHMPYGGYRLILPTEEQLETIATTSSNPGRRQQCFSMIDEHLWLTVCLLGRYNYFGVGEDLNKSYIVTKTKVEVLLVPRVQFLKVGRGKILDLMREDLNKLMPDDRTLFQHYFADLKWRKYKSNVVQEIIQRRNMDTSTTIYDVPYSIRLDSQRSNVDSLHY